jgi:ribose 5-phosphate isomerase B
MSTFEEGIEAMRVVLVCSGNTCRSPLAAAVLGRERPTWQVASAGLAAVPGSPAAAGAVRAALARGLDLTTHRAERVTAAALEDADVILTMTEGQRAALAAEMPTLAARLLTLAEAAGTSGDVEDPYGSADETYARTLEQIERLVVAAARNLSREAPLGRVVAAGADHAGYELKDLLVDDLRSQGFRVDDHGTQSDESCDYPDFAAAVAADVAAGRAGFGLLVCGTGLGMQIAANKVAKVRAVAVSEPVSARLARAHNDANVVCLGGRIVGPEVGRAIVRAFASTVWEGGRHAGRLDKIRALEQATGGVARA